MDLTKVFDQAVREIKREVNLKVLKVPELEQKVLDATDDEPWGPHGTVLAEIAQATKKFSECQMVMNVLWTRLTETGKNWRLVYKALAVIEYLVAHGSERAVDDIIEHTYHISSLASYEYVEPSGKDLGINVRKKAETIVALLHNQDKIQEVRSKAAANRDKYFGLLSSGVTYKSGAASFSSSSFRSSDRYGGFGNMGDRETFKSSHRDGVRNDEEKYERTTKSEKEHSYSSSKKQESATTGASKTLRDTSNSDPYTSLPSQTAPSGKYDDDFDDFDPRGTSTSKSSTGSNQVDLFGQNLVDLLDAPLSHPTENLTSLNKDPSEVDLFGDANFVSATPQPKVLGSSMPQTNVDLFASQPAPALSTTTDFFAAPDLVSHPDNKAIKSDTSNGTVDPFAAVPLNNFNVSNPFGVFASHTDPLSTLSNNSSPKGGSHRNTNESLFETTIPQNTNESLVEPKIPGNKNASSVETETIPKKQAFQVNSGIWADSLSRGLIDLDITASKKVDLADVGVVGGLTDGLEEKDRPSFYNRAMAIGSGAGKSGFSSSRTSTSNDFFSSTSKSGFSSPRTSTSNDFFSSLNSQQYQFGAFPK